MMPRTDERDTRRDTHTHKGRDIAIIYIYVEQMHVRIFSVANFFPWGICYLNALVQLYNWSINGMAYME